MHVQFGSGKITLVRNVVTNETLLGVLIILSWKREPPQVFIFGAFMTKADRVEMDDRQPRVTSVFAIFFRFFLDPIHHRGSRVPWSQPVILSQLHEDYGPNLIRSDCLKCTSKLSIIPSHSSFEVYTADPYLADGKVRQLRNASQNMAISPTKAHQGEVAANEVKNQQVNW